MKILLFGEQAKYFSLIRYLQGREYDVAFPQEAEEDISSYDIVIFPKNDNTQNENIILDTNTILANLTSHTGKFTLQDLESFYIENVYDSKKLYPSFLQNPEIVKEGIVSDLIVNQNIIENIPNIMIIGYQNLGKKVTYALQTLGLNVKVGVDNQKDKMMLKYYGVRPFYLDTEEMQDLFKKADIIINTLYDYHLKDACFKEMQKGAYVLDASIYGEREATFYNDLDITYKKIYAGLTDPMEEFNLSKVLTIKIKPEKRVMYQDK